MDTSHALALEVALVELDPGSQDAAAVALATAYAEALDQAEEPSDLTRLGPQYLAALSALGLTPAARAALTGRKDAPGEQVSNPLDELRHRRAGRRNDPPTLDASAP